MERLSGSSGYRHSSKPEPEDFGETVVEATWVRTTLRGPMRTDQWAAAVTSSSDTLTLTLPVLAEDENENGEVLGSRIARARVNNSPWTAADEATGRVNLDLGQTRGTRLLLK